jgi:hypothetical protein
LEQLLTLRKSDNSTSDNTKPRGKEHKQPINRMQVATPTEEDSDEQEEGSLDGTTHQYYNTLFGLKGDHPIKVDVVVAGEPLTMELDTGAAVSVISEGEFDHRLRKHVKLDTTSLELHIYTGEKVKPIGVCTVTVKHGDQERALPLHVLAGNGTALLGRDWLREINFQCQLLQLKTMNDLHKILRQYETVFSPGLGRMRNIKARITLQAGHQPRFWKARPIPLARKQAVDSGLED